MKRHWKDGVYADCSSFYVSSETPGLGDEVSFKLRVFSNSGVTKVFFSTTINGEERVFAMTYVYSKHHFDYYMVNFKIIHPVTKYHYIIIKDNTAWFYNQKGIEEFNCLKRWEFTLIADKTFPEWVKEAVFYQIYPDRFYNGNPENDVVDGEFEFDNFIAKKKHWNDTPSLYKDNGNIDFFGGDLDGIIQKIDYLLDLGINAIYLNPIFTAYSNHKYDCIDYFHVDKHFGGDEALIRLIEALHENGIRLILDISINHVGKCHPWVKEKPEFFFYDETGSAEGWNGFADLVVLNYNSAELKEIIYGSKKSVLKKWLSPPYNADGWRFDVGQSTGRMKKSILDFSLWREIRKEIKTVKPEAYLFTEHWDDCVDYLQGDMWDASMNYYGCTRAVRKFLGDVDKFLDYKTDDVPLQRSAQILKNEVMDLYSFIPYTTWSRLLNLLSSHDYPRINMGLPKEATLVAPLVLFILPGVPCVYYGEEINLRGFMEHDSGFRFPMEWNRERWDMEVFDMYRFLIAYRKRMEVLKRGCFRFVYAQNDIVAIARFNEETSVLLVFSNGKTKKCHISLDAIGYYKKCAVVKDIGSANWYFDDNSIIISFDYMGGVLFELS